MSFGKVKITNFGKRHFETKSGGTKITNTTINQFEKHLEEELSQGFVKIMDGYAPFCKLLAIDNFTDAKVGSMKIDLSNFQYLRHGYSSRTEQELPVLSRWFELPIPAPKANFLIVVVYSREQLFKEYEKQKMQADVNSIIPDFELAEDEEWGVVAILGQSHSNEEPMQPITMMRNALGMEEGGSGVPLDKKAYDWSVRFWSENAIVKS